MEDQQIISQNAKVYEHMCVRLCQSMRIYNNHPLLLILCNQPHISDISVRQIVMYPTFCVEIADPKNYIYYLIEVKLMIIPKVKCDKIT